MIRRRLSGSRRAIDANLARHGALPLLEWSPQQLARLDELVFEQRP